MDVQNMKGDGLNFAPMHPSLNAVVDSKLRKDPVSKGAGIPGAGTSIGPIQRDIRQQIIYLTEERKAVASFLSRLKRITDANSDELVDLDRKIGNAEAILRRLAEDPSIELTIIDIKNL